MRACRYSVKISRWDIYRVEHVLADSHAEAEERAIEIFEGGGEYEHFDGGLNFVEAEPEDD